MKSGEIKDLSVEDLKEKIGEMEVMQEKLVLTHQISPLENPIQLRELRRTVARVATELTKRELQ